MLLYEFQQVGINPVCMRGSAIPCGNPRVGTSACRAFKKLDLVLAAISKMEAPLLVGGAYNIKLGVYYNRV